MVRSLISRKNPNQRGAVLIAVLALSALAAAVAMEVAYLARIEGERVTNVRDRIQAEMFARAGTLVAEDVLFLDGKTIDAAGDNWTEPIEIKRPEGMIEVTIQDEKARFPLASLFREDQRLNLEAKSGFERLVAGVGLSADVVDAIIDYVDPDDVVFLKGAESEYYGSLDPPRKALNRPFVSLDELSFVRGLEGLPGQQLMNICTLNTDGKVNINTASAPVLSALMPTLTKMKAARIASRAQVFPFKSVGELRDAVGLENREMEVMARLATVKSDVFRIESTGISGNVEVIMVSIVLRSNEGFQVLSRRIN